MAWEQNLEKAMAGRPHAPVGGRLERQQIALRLYRGGWDNREIARHLNVSVRSVERYISLDPETYLKTKKWPGYEGVAYRELTDDEAAAEEATWD
jgi:Sigma-70, region 4